ncbi:MAG: type IX secretion system protein PorQ [Bacteroidales bacterium]|nr:type IX secretion system protein PorQ [Bacteroidales bacterium]
MLKKSFVVILIFTSFISVGQIGGTHSFQFLTITNNAKVNALGGENLTASDNDLGMVFHNPSLLNDSMDNNLVMNYVNYVADINFGYVSYARHFKKYGNFGAGLHYLNYGEFIKADEAGVISGNFTASDYDLNLYWAKPLDSLWTIGAAFKTLYSKYYSYFSSAVAIDAGITYFNPKRQFSFAAVVKNLGVQIKRYDTEYREPLPFDLLIGVSKKIKHAPFRLSFTFNNLTKYDLTYDSPLDVVETNVLVDSSTVQKENKFLKTSDKVFRHIIIGVEFIPIKNFYVGIGYNYRRRQELKISTHPALVGFSFGAGIKISNFYFAYSRALYNLAGASNVFSVRTNLNSVYKNLNHKKLS